MSKNMIGDFKLFREETAVTIDEYEMNDCIRISLWMELSCVL